MLFVLYLCQIVVLLAAVLVHTVFALHVSRSSQLFAVILPY